MIDPLSLNGNPDLDFFSKYTDVIDNDANFDNPYLYTQIDGNFHEVESF